MQRNLCQAALVLLALAQDVWPADSPPAHEQRQIEGWRVMVDPALLEGPQAALGQTALRLLGDQLFQLTLRLPAPRIEELRRVPIWIDREHELKGMQYHPSRQWLTEHGYDPAMAGCVHIARAQVWIDHHARYQQPAALLHELAHAYHDQILGWDDRRIREAWQKFVAGGRYVEVLDISGNRREHYALKNEKEFFAEMTESCLATNDFYPFVRGELRSAEPEIFELLQDIWLSPSELRPARR